MCSGRDGPSSGAVSTEFWRTEGWRSSDGFSVDAVQTKFSAPTPSQADTGLSHEETLDGSARGRLRRLCVRDQPSKVGGRGLVVTLGRGPPRLTGGMWCGVVECGVCVCDLWCDRMGWDVIWCGVVWCSV